MGARKSLSLVLEPALWELVLRLQRSMNVQLRQLGKPELNLAGVVSAVVRNALLENAEDILDEYQQKEAARVTKQLARFLSPAELAACGLPGSTGGAEASEYLGDRGE